MRRIESGRQHPLACMVLAGLLSFAPASAETVEPVRSGSVVFRAPTTLAGGGPDPLLLRFTGPLDVPTRTAIDAVGLRIVAHLGSGVVVVRAAGPSPEAIVLPRLAGWAPLEPGLRIAPALVVAASAPPVSSKTRLPVTIQLDPRVDLADRVRELTRAGHPVRGSAHGHDPVPGDPNGALRPASIVIVGFRDDLPALLERVAAWPETLWIGKRPVYGLLNDQSAWVVQTGLDGGQATPLYDNGLFGDGQTVAVLDTGIDVDSCYFRDDSLPPAQLGLGPGPPDLSARKVTIVDFLWSEDFPPGVTEWDDQGHGTHVAGTVAGDDPTTPERRDASDGMAPAAKLVIQDGGFARDDCSDLPGIGCPAADLYPFFEQAYMQGARIHTNSWGDRENLPPYGFYSEGSAAADAFMWDHPDFLLVFAAGNGGPGETTVLSPATAKNVLAVGATNPGEAAGTLASFSSWGPTDDGRVKPDVLAPGVAVLSAQSDGDVSTNNCGQRSASGTSMSTPTVAGLAALARQYFMDGFHPTGAPQPGDAFTPSAALLKATLIVSAVPMEGESTPPPSGAQGWGRVRLDDALYLPGDASRLFVADRPALFNAPDDLPDVHPIEVLDGQSSLRVVLTWTDYPSSSAATLHLVNDLDLEVQAPGGAVYRGNDFIDGVSQADGIERDDRNNVEVVHIDKPQPGTWQLRVQPRAIEQPGQGYALAATGRLPVPDVQLELVAVTPDDSPGGNANGVLEPGEWVDLVVAALGVGSQTATAVSATVESLTPGVEVVHPTSSLPDLTTGTVASSSAPHPRIRLSPAFPCTEPVELRLTLDAAGEPGWVTTLVLGTGFRDEILRDDLEGPTGWQHSAAESTATQGDWVLGDPIGNGFQPEVDATPAPGVTCLFTGDDPSSRLGEADVDDGVVVARSGPYDLSGHADVRVEVQRWFGNRDLGEDPGDFFRLEIRHDAASPDVLLEELGSSISQASWTPVNFRVADFVEPGAGVELKVSVADGASTGNIIEAAIDEILFWEPRCEIHDPPPAGIDSLIVTVAGDDLRLTWTTPAPDPQHGEATRFTVHRSLQPAGGFAEHGAVDAGDSLELVDVGARAAAGSLFYLVIGANAAGDSEPLP